MTQGIFTTYVAKDLQTGTFYTYVLTVCGRQTIFMAIAMEIG